MSRLVWIVGVAAALMAAGCLTGSFLGRSQGVVSGPRVVAGSVNAVSQAIQQGLCEVGIAAVEKRDHEDVLLVGVTGTGKVFCVRLRAQKAQESARTAVSIQWDREADETFWRTVVELLPAATS